MSVPVAGPGVGGLIWGRARPQRGTAPRGPGGSDESVEDVGTLRPDP